MKKQKKPSKYALLAAAVAQDWAHQNSIVVNSQRRITQFHVKEVDQTIIDLQAALTSAREGRAHLMAMLEGLSAVLDKR